MATKQRGQTPAIERLLADLIRYAEGHPNYGGRVEVVSENPPAYRLRYYNMREVEAGIADGTLTEQAREISEEDNAGAKAVDNIAKRVIRLMKPWGVSFPDGVTDGARVLAWVLDGSFVSSCGKYQRGSAAPVYRPFEAIHEKALETIEGEPSEQQAEAGSPPLRVCDPPAVVVATDDDEQTGTPDGDSKALTSATGQRPPYKWKEFLVEDGWIYENIHSSGFDDLRVEHAEHCQSRKHFKKPLSRRQYWARADRYAEYHESPKRRFKGACGCPDCQPVSDT